MLPNAKYTNKLVYFALADAFFFALPDAKPRRQPVEYRLRWVSWHRPCTFHVHFMLFVHFFRRWHRENQPTQRQIPVEYRLKRECNWTNMNFCIAKCMLIIKEKQQLIGPWIVNTQQYRTSVLWPIRQHKTAPTKHNMFYCYTLKTEMNILTNFHETHWHGVIGERSTCVDILGKSTDQFQ